MGGHVQFGEYHNLKEATEAFYAYRAYYEEQMYLWLTSASIVYDSETRKFTLAMRFSK